MRAAVNEVTLPGIWGVAASSLEWDSMESACERFIQQAAWALTPRALRGQLHEPKPVASLLLGGLLFRVGQVGCAYKLQPVCMSFKANLRPHARTYREHACHPASISCLVAQYA